MTCLRTPAPLILLWSRLAFDNPDPCFRSKRLWMPPACSGLYIGSKGPSPERARAFGAASAGLRHMEEDLAAALALSMERLPNQETV